MYEQLWQNDIEKREKTMKHPKNLKNKKSTLKA